MPPFNDLILTDGMLVHWLSVRDVPINRNHAYHLWNVVLTRTLDTPSGPVNHDVFIKGIIGSPTDAARCNDGIPNKPNPMRILADLLDAARDVDDYPHFPDWLVHVRSVAMDAAVTPARVLQLQQEFGRDRARRDLLRGWLGDDYDMYVKAAADYLTVARGAS